MTDHPAPPRILVVGAGAIGGYFGGRLLAAGRDVTFLVRPGRAAQLARDGLVIRSPCGDVHVPAPPHVLADDLRAPFDLVLLSCKAYDLDGAMTAMAAAVGAATMILPLLNGLRHLDALDARFGAARVLGGQCAILATLDPAGTVRHLGAMHALSFGRRDGTPVPGIAAMMQNAGFDGRMSGTILHDMWEKWVLLATMAGSTCLLRAAVGDIMAAGGRDFVRALLAECCAVAAAAGYAPRAEALARTEAMLLAAGAPTTASMLRDIEQGGRIEADHIIADLLARHAAAGPDTAAPLLRLVLLHLRAYEARRARSAAA